LKIRTLCVRAGSTAQTQQGDKEPTAEIPNNASLHRYVPTQSMTKLSLDDSSFARIPKVTRAMLLHAPAAAFRAQQKGLLRPVLAFVSYQRVIRQVDRA
jgi:hypothetical protein